MRSHAGLSKRIAELWLGWGAVVVAVMLLLAVTAALTGHRTGRIAIAVGWFGLAWQVGSYVVIVRSLDFVEPVRPGLGIAVSAAGVLGLTVSGGWKVRATRQSSDAEARPGEIPPPR
jgi:hypothetical protein